MGKDIGFLPGDISEKPTLYMQPIYDNVEFLMSGGTAVPTSAVKKKLQEYLNPGEEVATAAPVAAESIAPVTPAAVVAEETDLSATLGNHKTDFTLETAVTGNKSTVNKFDDLFN